MKSGPYFVLKIYYSGIKYGTFFDVLALMLLTRFVLNTPLESANNFFLQNNLN